MDIRELEYFVEIAREENMSRAAENLHVSQSTVSKQIKELEDELGVKLFHRLSNGIVLTDDGQRMKNRAEDILDMVYKTTAEFHSSDIEGGEIYLGCAESVLISQLAECIKSFKTKYPRFQYHLITGDRRQTIEKLDQGLFDFACVVEQPDPKKFNFLKFKGNNTYGFLMHKDHPLSHNESITPDDLSEFELIIPEAATLAFSKWCGNNFSNVNISGTVTMFYNGSLFVRSNLGILLTFEHLLDLTESSDLVFKPLSPVLPSHLYLCWKKDHLLTPIATRFLHEIQEYLK